VSLIITGTVTALFAELSGFNTRPGHYWKIVLGSVRVFGGARTAAFFGMAPGSPAALIALFVDVAAARTSFVFAGAGVAGGAGCGAAAGAGALIASHGSHAHCRAGLVSLDSQRPGSRCRSYARVSWLV